MSSSMKAVVINVNEREKVVHTPIPKPTSGQVLVKIDATTVITSEVATRAGVSMAKLPLILGNDFVGTICEAPNAEECLGQRVIGGYQGYGYTRDGAWAEYIWSFTAASGSLRALGDLRGKTILIHGGTSGVGLAATTMALGECAKVISTSRSEEKLEKLLAHGVTHAILDSDNLKEKVLQLAPEGVDLVLEILGVSGLVNSIQCVRPFGVVWLTGLLNDQFNSIKAGVREDRSVPAYPHPMELIPPTVRLTIGGVDGTPRTGELVQRWIKGLEDGLYRMPIDSIFKLDDIDKAIQRRTSSSSFGKIVLQVI